MADIKSQGAVPAAAPAAVPSSGLAGIPVIGALVNRFQAVFKAGPQHLDIGLVNNVLMVIIAVLIIYFFMSFGGSFSDLKKLSGKEYSIVSASKSESGFKEIATMKGVAYYVGKLSGRDIFHKQVKTDQLGNEPVFSSKMADLTAHLKLVGISMSDDPDAMIEDTQLQKTFFVKKGAMVGDLRVDNITKDKVVLRMGKEIFELK